MKVQFVPKKFRSRLKKINQIKNLFYGNQYSNFEFRIFPILTLRKDANFQRLLIFPDYLYFVHIMSFFLIFKY